MSNIDVKITADVVDYQTKMALAQATARATSAELSKFARDANANGMTDQLQSQLTATAEKLVIAKNKVTDLKAELNTGTNSFAGFRQAGALATETLGAFGVAVSAAAIVGFGEKVLNNAADIQHMANMLGMGATELQAYQFAARASGVSTQDADMFMRRFMATLGEMEQGGAPAAQQAIRELGITVDDLAANPSQAIYTFAAALKSANLPAERIAATLKELGGKGGQDITNMLGMLAGGFDDAAHKASVAGEMIDPQLTEAAEQANIKFDEAATKLLDRLAPGVIAAIDHLTDLVKVFSDLQDVISQADDAMDESDFVEGKLHARGMGWNDVLKKRPLTGLDSSTTFPAMTPQMTTPQMPAEPAAPEIKVRSPEQEAADAKRVADDIIRANKEKNDKIIEGEEQTNATRLSMGLETDSQWAQQEKSLAQQKYDADVKALQGQEATGKINHAQYLADKAVLDQEYANKKQQIDNELASKEQSLRQQDLSESLKALDGQLKSGKDRIEQDYHDHKIGIDQKAADERDLTTTIITEQIKQLTAERTHYAEGTALYNKYTSDIKTLQQRLGTDLKTIDNQALNEEEQKWKQFSASIASSVGSAVKGMIFQQMTWQRAIGTILEGVADAFLQMGEKILEDWIEKLILQEVVTKTTTAETSLGQITSAAAVAGAQGTASFAGAPWPIDMGAPGFGAAMAAEAMSFASMLGLDVGAWELPGDMPAMLHKGEMVVPQDFASGLRANGGGLAGAVTFNNHYYPTVNMRGEGSEAVRRVLQTGGAEFAQSIRRGYRTGSPMRPSGRTV